MKRLLAGVALLMLSIGCAQRGAPFSNPFIGSDVVPPPGTRGLAPGQAEPYYGPPTQYAPPVVVEPTSQIPRDSFQNGVAPDITPVASGSPRLAANSSNSPAGSFSPGGEPPVRVPEDQRRIRFEPPATAVAASSQVAPASNRPPGPATVRQTRNELALATTSAPENYGPWRQPAVAGNVVPAAAVQPYYQSETPVYSDPVGCYTCEPRAAVTGPQTVEITELPPPGTRVRRRASSDGSPTRVSSRNAGTDSFVAAGTRTYRDESVRLAGGVMADSGSSSQLLQAVGDSTPRTWARYGYHDTYDWLQGRLEYLRATGQWKLRYIPVDGVTDQFGGSVVLDDVEGFEGLRPGDFVRVQGRLESSRTAEETYSPPYRVASLQPLAD